MGPIYHFLGVSVGMITHDASYLFEPGYPTSDERLINLRPVERSEAYAADVTYGTNNEFGFDYLRDNMVDRPRRSACSASAASPSSTRSTTSSSTRHGPR